MATGVKNLLVYQMAYGIAKEIHEISKTFPSDELYSLTNQIKRSSRSVCTNLAEGYRKRRYQAHFINKITDADMENTETQTWLDFAKDFKFIDESTYSNIMNRSISVGRMLDHMINNPEKFNRNW